jgi:hypothetical protein
MTDIRIKLVATNMSDKFTACQQWGEFSMKGKMKWPNSGEHILFFRRSTDNEFSLFTMNSASSFSRNEMITFVDDLFEDQHAVPYHGTVKLLT